MASIGRLNTAVYRNMQGNLSYKLRDLSIKNGQYDFFYVISKNPGISQKDLSAYLHIGKSTTAKAVHSLTESGYVRREKDLRDGRIDRLFLTEQGQQLAGAVDDIFEENRQIASRNLTEEEEKTLTSLLERVLQNFEEVKRQRHQDANCENHEG